MARKATTETTVETLVDNETTTDGMMIEALIQALKEEPMTVLPAVTMPELIVMDDTATVPAAELAVVDEPILLLETPFGFEGDGWLTNELVVTGVIAPQRTDRKTKKQWGAPTRRTDDGGTYKVFTVRINEVLSDADAIGDDLLMTQLEVLIPVSHPLIPHLETVGGTVSLRGRLDQTMYRNMAQERRLQNVENGVYLQRQEAVIVRALRLVDPSEPHYAVGHLTGKVDRVLQLNQPLRYGDSQRYHIVRLEVSETRARRAPSRGVEHLTTTVTLLVPTAFPEAVMLINPGNQVSVEYGVKRIVRWLGDRQLELVKDDAKEKARMRIRDEWAVTVIAPHATAVMPDAERLEAIRQSTAERNRTRRHNARMIRERRVEAAAVAAERGSDATPLAPVKRRRVHGIEATGAAGIPALDGLEVMVG